MVMLMTIAGTSLAIAGLYAASPQDVRKQAGAPGDSQKKAGPTMPGGPGFGPGMFLAPQVFEIADSDKDGRLTIEEATRAAEQFIREADAEKKGSIDAGALGLALNRRMMPPGEGPGPGGPPGGFGPGTFLAPQIIESWIDWMTGFLAGTPEQRRSEAEAALAVIDGLLLLRQLAGPAAADRAASRLGILPAGAVAKPPTVISSAGPERGQGLAFHGVGLAAVDHQLHGDYPALFGLLGQPGGEAAGGDRLSLERVTDQPHLPAGASCHRGQHDVGFAGGQLRELIDDHHAARLQHHLIEGEAGHRGRRDPHLT